MQSAGTSSSKQAAFDGGLAEELWALAVEDGSLQVMLFYSSRVQQELLRSCLAILESTGRAKLLTD